MPWYRNTVSGDLRKLTPTEAKRRDKNAWAIVTGVREPAKRPELEVGSAEVIDPLKGD